MKLPRMIRNLWIYRTVIGLAILLGVVASFVISNRQEVDVKFPLLGTVHSWSGIVMLVSAALGAAGTWLVMKFRVTLREARAKRARELDLQAGSSVPHTVSASVPQPEHRGETP